MTTTRTGLLTTTTVDATRAVPCLVTVGLNFVCDGRSMTPTVNQIVNKLTPFYTTNNEHTKDTLVSHREIMTFISLDYIMKTSYRPNSGLYAALCARYCYRPTSNALL